MGLHPGLEIDAAATRDTIIGFIRRMVTEASRKAIVLGVSGGLDSAVSCYLAAQALGPENVIGITNPYATSNPDSLADGLRVIQGSGVRHEHFEITPMVDPLFAAFPKMDRRRRGNAMARARMIVWFDRSEMHQALVLGSSNRTEWLLGYSTLYGDSACSLMPICDLYKSQVRQLGRLLGVPEQVLAKAPSADLWPGQTDEEELGLTYDDADSILYLLTEAEEAVRERDLPLYDPKVVREVERRMCWSAFKRRMPPICEV